MHTRDGIGNAHRRYHPCGIMFTGLIQHVGVVSEVRPRQEGIRLRIDPDEWSHEPTHGESISVNGCCLTVVDASRGGLEFDCVAQTLAKTTLGGLGPGQRVNLERALRASDFLGGHFVQGHVDGVGTVRSVQDRGGDYRLVIEVPSDVSAFLIPRGSITVDGVSLTLAGTDARTFEVALIPTTLDLTTLGDLRVGDPVNLEADVLAKTTVTWLERLHKDS